MAGKGIVQVEGARQLRKTLSAAGDDLQELKDIHGRVASIVANRGKQNAPKVTGTMAGTIRSSGTKTAAIVRAGYKRTPYAGPNQWGWPAGADGIRGSYTGGHWLTQAAKQTEPAWLNLYVSDVEKALSKVKGI